MTPGEKDLNPPIKRLLAFAGSVVAGLFGAIVLASPAQAHHPLITGTSVCQADGKYKITWTVSNGDWENPYMKIIAVQATPNTPVTNIAVETWLDPDASVTGVQYVPGTSTGAKLYVDANWYLHKTDSEPKVHNSATKELTLPGTCKAEAEPSVTFEDRCDGTINVHLVNPTETKKTFRIKGTNNDYEKIVEIAKGEKDESVEASAGALTVSVKKGETWAEIGRHAAWARPEKCSAPTVFSWSTCDKLTIKVTNPPENQSTTAEVTYGTQTKKKDVAPGTTEEFVFDAGSTTKATVKLSGWETITVDYQRPQNCDTLPQTGSSTTTFLASGAGLATLGGLAFFFARRRMVRLRKLASY